MTQTTAMCRRLASDAKGIESIVREHYRENYGSVGIDVRVDIDMGQLIVTVYRWGLSHSHRIQRIFCNKQSLYCVHVLDSE